MKTTIQVSAWTIRQLKALKEEREREEGMRISYDRIIHDIIKPLTGVESMAGCFPSLESGRQHHKA